MPDVSRETGDPGGDRGADAGAETSAGRPPLPSSGAVSLFGDRLALAQAFAARLADTGVSHGLIGPGEVPRLWDRHIVNCAVIEDAFPEGVTVIDVGSGAGLPGLAVAIARPDLEVHLIEPMRRRTDWLSATVADLALTTCHVHRGRAEEFHGTLVAPFVTARAVAPIDRLARWAFPLLEDGGRLIAMKGRTAESELAAHRDQLAGWGMVAAEVTEHGVGVIDPPTRTLDITVVHGHADATTARRSSPGSTGASRASSARRGSRRRTGRRRGHGPTGRAE